MLRDADAGEGQGGRGKGQGGLGIPARYFAVGNALAPPLGVLPKIELDASLERLGFAVLEFASGARAVVLAGNYFSTKKKVSLYVSELT